VQGQPHNFWLNGRMKGASGWQAVKSNQRGGCGQMIALSNEV
jgi:hypothetical protein